MAGITLILGLVYAYVYLISSQVSYQRLVLVLIEGSGIASGQTGLFFNISTHTSTIYSSCNLCTQVATSVLIQHWFLQATAFYAQTIFPIKFVGFSLVSPLFLQNTQISCWYIEFIMDIHLCLGWASTCIDVKSQNSFKLFLKITAIPCLE